jgi:hypothetical protein
MTCLASYTTAEQKFHLGETHALDRCVIGRSSLTSPSASTSSDLVEGIMAQGQHIKTSNSHPWILNPVLVTHQLAAVFEPS